MKNLNQIAVLPALLFLIIISGSSCVKNYALSNSPWDSVNISSDSITFIVMGDWGKHGGESQKPVADQMDVVGRKFGAQFIITTGDNFYPTGVSSITDGHWTTSFENVYSGQGLKIPWYPVLGNHDYQSNPQAQVDYSSKSNRWTMPARYHSFKKNIGALDSALFVFTDTSPFVEEYYGREMVDLRQQDTAAQMRWLKQTLSATGNSWKIVIGHHPLYSVGRHGDTKELIQRYRPLFNQTGTDFYLAGHDHSLQHIYFQGDPTNYLVSGAASEGTSVKPHYYSPFAVATPGFLVMTLYPHRANFYFYNQKGELLHRKQVLK
jgi:tartrate-resistant acid phosphatase type 5